MSLENLGLRELQNLYAELYGHPTRCPNRVWLIRRVTERLEQSADVAEAVSAGGPLEATSSSMDGAEVPAHITPEDDVVGGAEIGDEFDGDVEPSETPRSKMSIPELVKVYESVVGRPTASVHRRYLLWKIREVETGRLPAGPRQATSGARSDGPQERVLVLPLRMTESETARLDEAWRSAGAASRTAFLKELIAKAVGSLHG